METKYKIIFVVFLLVFVLYAILFLVNYMNTKTKETFLIPDLLENYEDKPSIDPPTTTTTSETKYDQRILILDDIERLRISDKEVKGKLMEKLFSEESLKSLSTMSTAERMSYITRQYDEVKSSQVAVLPAEKVQPIVAAKTADPSPVSEPKKATFQSDPADKDSGLDLVKRAQETLSYLRSVEDGLMDIKKTAERIKGKPPGDEADTYKEPLIPSPPLIEGFENIRNYASPF